jgi:hypothetical protein
MAVSDVSAAYEDAVRTFLERFENLVRSYGGGAQSSYGSHVWRILQPAYARKVRTGVRTPVA